MGLIVPLALVGLVLGRGLGDAHQRLLAGFVLAWLISGLLFTVCARYRLPATPFLIIWAGSGLVGLADIVRRRHVATAGKAVAAGLVGLLAAYTGVDRDAVDHLRSEWLLAHLRIRQGDYRGAETALQAALRRDPHSADVHNSFGVVHEYLGRPAEAERAYRRALEQEAEFARAWMNLSRLSLRGGRLTDAADALRRVIDLDPRSRVQYEAWYQLGQIRLAQEQHEAALNAFSQALQAKATALAWYGRSVASAGLGKTEDQVRCLEKAVALDPGLAPAQRNLGALHLQIGRYEEAETALRAAAAADPGNGLTYRHLAGLYEQTGRREEARQARAQARRLGAR
jgi:tetratricopeptide (TPR) repeat protein